MAAQYPVIASNGFAHHMHAVALFKVFTRIYGTGLFQDVLLARGNNWCGRDEHGCTIYTDAKAEAAL